MARCRPILLLILFGWLTPRVDAAPPAVLEVDKVWSGHPVGFALLTAPPFQYVAYYDAERRMSIAQRRLESDRWSYQRLPSTLGWDSHNAVTLAVDRAGQLHVTGNMHGTPLVYFRTTKVGDLATLTAAQMRRLLAGCDALEGETAADAMRAYIALAGFAGIRPEELHKLNWRDVNLTEGFVDIRSNVSKVKEARLVRLSENCKAWLAPCAARVGVVAPKAGFRYRFDAVRAAAGFSVRGNKGEPWPADVLRHSYASCWLAIYKNRAELAELMGNSPAIIGKHYRRPIPQAEAEEWFAIWPDAEDSKIIAMA
jgi:integrase